MEKKKKRKIALVIFIVAVAILAGIISIWAKGYYNNQYVQSDTFYTQIPVDEINEDSWIYDQNGNKAEEGKEYELKGYNEDGKERNISFRAKGKAADYYQAGTYIRVKVSDALELGESTVQESEVPAKALDKIKSLGTKRS